MSNTDSDYSVFQDITILIVEDDESELEELCELFGVYFKVCYSAIDGKDGLNKFIQYRPDIVLTDYSMPFMNGIDMSKKIKEIDGSMSIVLHTVISEVDTFIKAIKCKISRYVLKPTNVKNLLNILVEESKEILKNRELKKKTLLMQTILDEFPEAMIVTDLDHNVLFANNKIKNNRFWQKDKPMKCYEALYGFDDLCYKKNYKCDSMEAKRLGCSVTHLNNLTGKNGEKLYLNIKTIPLKDEKGNVYALLKSIQDKTSDKKRELELQHLANHDVLTGLPNRILLNDRLNQAILRSNRDKTCFAVMFIDFDEFKKINDTYGHNIGDQVLIEVAFRMQESIRKIDTIARIGGDEFVVVLEGILNKKQIEDIMNEMLKKLKLAFHIKNNKQKIYMTCSIGIDIYNPKRFKKSKEKLLQNADYAMFKAKRFGKDRFEFDLEAHANE